MDIYTADSYFLHDEMINCNFSGSTRKIYDMFLPRDVIKNNLINFCNKFI